MKTLEGIRSRVRDGITNIAGIQQVLEGKADSKLYQRYLMNVWHYAQHSSTVIGLAGARCVPDHPELARYLLHHALEELGHEAWAITDLAALGVSEDTLRASRPATSCAAMIGFEYFTAGHANPVGLFGWLYVLEAMGDDLGHVVADSIARGLDLPDGVKFLAGHGEADEEHTKDIIAQIETNIPAADMAYVHHVADVVGELYVRMFQEIEAG